MYQRIMIVVDEGPVARAALTEGLEVARTQGAQVLFFHVLPNYVMPMADAPPMVSLTPEQHRKDVERLAQRLLAAAMDEAQQIGVDAQTALGSNVDAATCISNAALEQGCDLIVIGSHGRSAMQRLLFGSVVSQLIHLSTLPMLVCKASPRRATVRPGTPLAEDAASQRAAPRA
jgi:nucleotide-binding universal stress UspA family protein